MPALAAPKENLYLSGGEPPAEKHFRPPTEVAKAPTAFISSVTLIGATAFRIFRIAALWAQKIAAPRRRPCKGLHSGLFAGVFTQTVTHH